MRAARAPVRCLPPVRVALAPVDAASVPWEHESVGQLALASGLATQAAGAAREEVRSALTLALALTLTLSLALTLTLTPALTLAPTLTPTVGAGVESSQWLCWHDGALSHVARLIGGNF